jgi:rhodanese-related sulfurtransferase
MPIQRAWDLVAEAKREIENLGIEALKREMAENADLLVVDIREIQERVDRGCIPGSVHVPRGMLEFWADPSLDYYREFFRPERRTILYCAGGGRSALAAKALKEMGYENVAHLEPGFDGWAKTEAVEDAASTSKWVRRR